MPVSPPPDAHRLRAGLLTPDSLWRDIDVVAQTSSTNSDLAALARLGEPEGLVVITDNQTAGRGRLDRDWTTPPGVATACSVLLRPGFEPARWPWLSLLTGVALVDGIVAASGVPTTLKWPNDVLVGDRKLCGLLAERVETPTGPAAVIGFGTNVSQSGEELPVPTATSLLLEGAEVDKSDLMIAILTVFAEVYQRWLVQPESLAPAYRERCSTVGQQVRVITGPGREVTGQAIGIDSTGGLVVQTPAGTRTFSAGDVVHLRRSE